MNYLRNGGLQTEIAAVGVDAGVVGEALGVAAKAEGIVGLVEVSGAEDEFGLAVALEAGAGDDVEDAVGAITEFCAVASAVNLEIVDVLGIKLGAEIGSDVCIRDGYAVD